MSETQWTPTPEEYNKLHEAALYTMQFNEAWDNCRFCGFNEKEYGGGKGHALYCPIHKLEVALRESEAND